MFLGPLILWKSIKDKENNIGVCWMFLGPAIWINSFANFGYISASTFDLLGPGIGQHKNNIDSWYILQSYMIYDTCKHGGMDLYYCSAFWYMRQTCMIYDICKHVHMIYDISECIKEQ